MSMSERGFNSVTVQISRLAMCVLLVVIGAAPGLILGWSSYDRTAMLLGVGVWIVLYWVIALSEWFEGRIRSDAFRRALQVVFSLKAIASFSVCGWIPDLSLGVGLLHLFSSSPMPGAGTLNAAFSVTLVVTLLHGLVMNIAIWLLILAMEWLLLHGGPADKPTGLCSTCGYDLRASPLRCPECGNATPPEVRQLASIGAGHSAASVDTGDIRTQQRER